LLRDYRDSVTFLQVETSKMQKFILAGLLGGTALISGCAGGLMKGDSVRAAAVLGATQGNKVAGTVEFLQSGDKLMVTAEVTGLTPGMHGFHIHEKGDCSAPDGTSAGGHFNPGGKPHGNPDHGEHHGGDMPQLVADAKGVARLTAYLSSVKIGDGPNDIIGRSIIVHASPDDFKTQPTGNSGARQACGLIVRK
jgi:Cu-Zn family superoxide dismutase